MRLAAISLILVAILGRSSPFPKPPMASNRQVESVGPIAADSKP